MPGVRAVITAADIPATRYGNAVKDQTVFAATQGRTKNRAYVPPELEDVTNYRFDAASDMYSFGVLLYELLTDRVPFPGPAEAV